MNGGFDIFTLSFQDGKTPLHVACIKQDFPMVQMLVERGANTAAQDQVCANHMMILEMPIISKQLLHYHGLNLNDKYEARQLVYVSLLHLEPEITLACSFCVVFTCTVDPHLSSYNRTPDHGQISEIAGYMNHHANRSLYCIISTAICFPVMLSIVGTNNYRISTFLGFKRSTFQHLWVFQQSNTASLLRSQHEH